jgi:hypothetical protein
MSRTKTARPLKWTHELDKTDELPHVTLWATYKQMAFEVMITPKTKKGTKWLVELFGWDDEADNPSFTERFVENASLETVENRVQTYKNRVLEGTANTLRLRVDLIDSLQINE